MYPFYFGPSQSQLFGAYHPPEGSSRNRAVLLCHPLGHEYIRVYRAFRNLAVELSQAGFPVMRFDYYGTGDSAGEADKTLITRCVSNIQTAIEELKDTSGAARVSLIGLRLGATMAAVVSAQRRDIDLLAAIDPIEDGRQYLDNLRRLHRQWLHREFDYRMFVGAGRRPWEEGVAEAIGFPLSSDLQRELEQLNVNELRPSLARRVCVLVSGADTAAPDVCGRFTAALSTSAEYVPVPSATNDWDDFQSVDQLLQPREMMNAVRSLLS